ncbi:hypothetical protein GLGCALEP_04106 [Pseudomonas sp. MM221]|nr:hypothetical protein GLGCALEP_04106 [Pseudomonas sp. MM221]
MSEIGKAISAAVAYVSKVGVECEALASLIKQELGELCRQEPLHSRHEPGVWSSSYKTDATGWVFSAAAWTLPLTAKDKPECAMHLAFQMSFLCDNAAGGFSPEPLLHINLWDGPTDVRSECYMGFEMFGLSPRTIVRLNDGCARLFRWGAEEGAAEQWTYTLPLAAINNLDDIRSLICKPISVLLANVDEGEAVLDEMQSAIRWSVTDGMGGFYRVVG